jgi:hypothetical protein
VNWQHIVGERDEFVCKRVLLNLASIAVLVFLTTPTVSYCYQALLNVMADNPQDADAKNIAAKWSQKVPVVLKFFFLTMLPPLIVISVNSILILFIHLLGMAS